MNNDKILDQTQPTASSPAQPVQPPAGSFSAGSINKEVQPSLTSPTEAIQRAGEEVRHEIDKKVAEAGVKEVDSRPFLTDQHQQAGLNHSVPPPQTAPTGLISPIMTKEEAAMQAKGNRGNSITWLAALFGRVFKMGFGKSLIPETA